MTTEPTLAAEGGLNIDSIKEVMDAFDPASLLPELEAIFEKVSLVCRVAVVLGPVLLVALGLVYLFLTPKEANHYIGYRCYFGMGSVQAWRFTQRLAGILFTALGVILGAVALLSLSFLVAFLVTVNATAITPPMYILFVLVGIAWAAINVNSLPMVVEMCKGSEVGKFTGYYYTFSMAAQVITPIVAGSLLQSIGYEVLFPYAAFFVGCSFVIMLFVKHGDNKIEAKKGLEAFDVED